jgi:hypothetical protein
VMIVLVLHDGLMRNWPCLAALDVSCPLHGHILSLQLSLSTLLQTLLVKIKFPGVTMPPPSKSTPLSLKTLAKR